MIKIKGLTRKFIMGDTELFALKNLTFDIPDGQFIAITGRSGSGKSTLLYNISLLDKPTSGSVNIGGQNVDSLENNERVKYRRDNFGFIFQDYALLPSLTAIENVMLPLLMQNKSQVVSLKQAQVALEQVGLVDKLYNLPSQLSGGQQQRVSIARSIVHKPKILFADEPTANLDTDSSKTVLDIFLKLNKTEKLTIVMVTHERDYAKIANRQIELLDGSIIKDVMTRKTRKY